MPAKRTSLICLNARDVTLTLCDCRCGKVANPRALATSSSPTPTLSRRRWVYIIPCSGAASFASTTPPTARTVGPSAVMIVVLRLPVVMIIAGLLVVMIVVMIAGTAHPGARTPATPGCQPSTSRHRSSHRNNHRKSLLMRRRRCRNTSPSHRRRRRSGLGSSSSPGRLRVPR